MKRSLILSALGLTFVTAAVAIQAVAQQPTTAGPPVGAPVTTATPSRAGGFNYVTEWPVHAVFTTPALQAEVEQYIAAKDDEARQAARAKIQTALGQLFDEQQKQREDQIKDIEAQLEQLREKLKKRGAARQQLIEHRLVGLIQDAEGLGWGGDRTAPKYGAGFNAVPGSPYALPSRAAK